MRERERRARAEAGYTTTEGVPQTGTVPVVVPETPSVVPSAVVDYSSMTKAELRDFAARAGIIVASRWTKADIIEAITAE